VNPHVDAALVPREPAFDDRTVEAGPVLARTATRLQERRVDQLVKMRPFCTGSIVLATSTSLRAATSGSAKGVVGDQISLLWVNRLAYRTQWRRAHL